MTVLPLALATMAARPYWCAWRYYTDDDGKRRKKPYDLHQKPGLSNEKRAQRGDPAVKLGTLAEVIALSPGAFAGVGFVPDINDSIACLDFDKLSEAGLDVLNLWNGCRQTTYCEFSPSRKGGHAIVILRPHAKERLRGIRNLISGMELYSDSGFFTVTGEVISDRPLADYSDRLVNLANRLAIMPKAEGATPVPTLLGRVVPFIEKGKIYEKISRWTNAQQFMDMRDSWEATAAWAPRGQNHPGPNRSALMLKFVSYLVRAGARDPDLLWAIIKESAVWREGYSKRANAEDTLWGSVVPLVLARQPPPPPSTGPAVPSHMKAADATFSFSIRTES